MSEIHHIINKVLADSASKEEQNLLDNWLREKPENQHSFDLKRQQWEEVLLVVDAEDKKRVFANIKNKINQDNKLIDFTERSSRKPSWGWMRVAASVVSLISLGALSYYEISDPFSHLNLVGYDLVEADAGVQKTQVLADGSTVYLNGDSRLKYRLTLNLKNESFILKVKPFLMLPEMSLSLL